MLLNKKPKRNTVINLLLIFFIVYSILVFRYKYFSMEVFQSVNLFIKFMMFILVDLYGFTYLIVLKYDNKKMYIPLLVLSLWTASVCVLLTIFRIIIIYVR